MKNYIISFGLIAFFFCKGWAQREDINESSFSGCK